MANKGRNIYRQEKKNIKYKINTLNRDGSSNDFYKQDAESQNKNPYDGANLNHWTQIFLRGSRVSSSFT
jgi:hypothetical protein